MICERNITFIERRAPTPVSANALFNRPNIDIQLIKGYTATQIVYSNADLFFRTYSDICIGF
jgi:hypothetical protein